MFKYFYSLSLGLLLMTTVVYAQSDVSVRSSCFNTLKAEALNIADFSQGAEGLSALEYSNLDERHSRYYQGHSSFGIDVDQPIFDMRIYSFGDQTGYIHPPYSPFPVGSQSESWKFPAKEFILAEEYVRRPDGERQFLGCGFFRIAATDLKAVTRENYLYDGDITSLMAKTSDHKLWYNFNTSFNHDDELMAYWYRLFVYPRETQNGYFSRYDVADSFPGNRVNDLSILSAEGIAARQAEGGEFPELEPVQVEGAFALNEYYQAIVNRFPDFGERLALRGFLEYENLQKLLASPNASAAGYVWDTVLDARDITRYALNRDSEERNPLFESVLNNPDNINREIEAMDLAAEAVSSSGAADVVETPTQVADTRPFFLQNQMGTFIMVVILLVMLFVLLSLILFFSRKHK